MDDFIQKTLVYNVAYKNFKTNDSGFDHITEFIHEYYNDKCVFVNTGHGFFKEPKIFVKDSNKYNRQKLIKKANKIGVVFFMYEPLCFYSKSENHLKLSFYQEFNHTVRDIFSYEVDDVVNFCKKVNITNYEIKICDYDYSDILLNSYPDVKISYEDIYIKSKIFFNIQTMDNKLNNRFVCPNARYTPHRHLIMCHLADKPGIYSWNFNCSEQLIRKISWLNKTHPYYKKIIINNKILNNNEYNIDEELPKTPVDRITDWKSISENVDHATGHDFYKNVFCAIVNETRFAQPFSNFSEKILRPIIYKIPFVLVAPPYTLELLKSRGFKTFDKWWDESYDIEEDHSKRLYKIFNIIDYINSLTDNEVEEIYKEMTPSLLFNSNHLENIEW